MSSDAFNGWGWCRSVYLVGGEVCGAFDYFLICMHHLQLYLKLFDLCRGDKVKQTRRNQSEWRRTRGIH